MKSAAISILSLLVSFSFTYAQSTMNKSKEKMQTLQFLTGAWEGEGWISFGPNQTQQLIQKEMAEYKLDSTVLTIEGRGIGKNSVEATPKVVHSAFAVINYDNQSQTYQIRAYKSNGQFVNATVDVGENKLIWGFEIPEGKVRYTMNISENNQWHEIGEFSRDGENWFKNFEMTLSKAVD